MGCGADSSSSLNGEKVNAAAQEVSFDYNFSSVVTQELATIKAMQSSNSTPKSLAGQETGANTNVGILSIQASDLMTGILTVTNADSGDVEVHNWAIYMDEADLNDVQSQKTLALVPGDYSFSLVLTKGDHQYVGEAIQTVGDTTQDLIAMTINPVIGDTLDDVDVTELVDFKFQYLASELAAAGLTAPSIGITIDNNNEQIFALNPATGLSESMYLNLMPGSYNIALRLLDGNVQVGRSISAQEGSVVVSPGLDVNMDIVPLHGEVALDLTVEGGDATFNFSIPSVVVEEAGGIANLEALFSVVGDENTLQESVLSLTDSGEFHVGTVTLAGMYYGDVTLSLAFTDTNDSELLGSCVNSVTLSVDTNSIVCDLNLRRRSVIAGSILSVVGVNVFAANGEPVAGAVISVDAEDVAMTNSAAFSTLGYSKLYLKAGTRIVRASANGLYGEISIDSIPLNVSNVDITLDQQELTLIPVRFYAEPEGATVVAGDDSCIITEGFCDLNLVVDDYLVELSAAGYISAEPYSLSVVNSAGMGVPLGELILDQGVLVDGYILTGTPTDSTVFNTLDQSYHYGNNLTNSIWNREADIIVTGEFSDNGYWVQAPGTAPVSSTPDNDTTRHYGRLVQVPSTLSVVFSDTANANGLGLGTASAIRVGTISTSTGQISSVATAVFSDGFSGSCQLLSASNTQVLCYDGTLIRKYLTQRDSVNLTADGTVSLSQPVPAGGACNPGAGCYGGTFAWDGMFYYFATSQNSSSSLNYEVYDASGSYVATQTATGTGAINGTYFDWSVARYSTHDGFGIRAATSQWGSGSDTHNFGPISSVHTLQ